MRDGDITEVAIKGCEFKRVGKNQTPLCELLATTADGDDIKIAIFLTEKSAGIARQQFKKFGFEIDKHDLSRLPAFIKERSPRVQVTIETREYNGNLYYQGAIEIGERSGNALPKDDLDEMTRWMRNSKKNREEESPPSAQAPATTTTPPRRPPPKPDPTFDDIPF